MKSFDETEQDPNINGYRGPGPVSLRTVSLRNCLAPAAKYEPL